jgi:hypothetical protein
MPKPTKYPATEVDPAFLTDREPSHTLHVFHDKNGSWHVRMGTHTNANGLLDRRKFMKRIVMNFPWCHVLSGTSSKHSHLNLFAGLCPSAQSYGNWVHRPSYMKKWANRSLLASVPFCRSVATLPHTARQKSLPLSFA